MRPEAEVLEVIKRLKEVRDRVPGRTHFGDDNHAAIDAQITVLEERLDENDCYKRFEPIEESEDIIDADDLNYEEGRSEHSLENAKSAAKWLHFEDDDDPASGWEELAKG